MNVRSLLTVTFFIVVLCAALGSFGVAHAESILETSMSDTLDTWREGRYEHLFDQLAHRGKTSRESFVKKMKGSTTRPACCWQKMEHFKILNEKQTEATVYVKIGLEGAPNSDVSTTREFKLSHMDGTWKMQLADVLSIAGVTGKKSSKKTSGKKRY